MTNQDIKQIHSEICGHLAARRLKPAFDLLARLIKENGLGIYYDEHRILAETYQNMLKYTVEGIKDPERQKVYQRLILSVFDLADKIHESLKMKHFQSMEYINKRAFSTSAGSEAEPILKKTEDYFLRDLEVNSAGKNDVQGKTEERGQEGSKTASDALQIHQSMKTYFNRIWFTDKLSVEEAKILSEFLSSQLIPVYYKSLFIAAIGLSLSRYFDSQKILILSKACKANEAEVSNRAVAGLLLNLYRYDTRLPFYPEVEGRLKILFEDSEFKSHLETSIIQFIRSKGTEKIQQLLRDEILPEMIKISPNLRDKIKLEGLMEEGGGQDRNPDWEDVFKDSPGLLNKLEEFSEMQMNGDDVFMGSFSMLKSFPFFADPVNWFMPFFPDNPEIADSLSGQETPWKLFEAIDDAPILCNSDKYSFCLSLPGLPKENMDMMVNAMQAEMEQVREIKADEALLNPGQKYEFVSNQYVQDLYRFYKLFPKSAGFEDVFSWRLDFHNKHILGDLIREDLKLFRNIGEYYFAKEHFDEASGIFQVLTEKEKSVDLLQKIAWCYQKKGDFQSALDHYLNAELFEANNVWNLKKIALCYRNLRKPEKALEYYRDAEKMEPENLGIQLNIGHCLLELDQYEDALKSYFKVEYIAPGNNKVWRPIGWCSFLTGKTQQAEKYFQKLMEAQPDSHDFINMGHVQWSLGKRSVALDFYRKAIAGESFSFSNFMSIFEEDLPHLLEQGIDKDDIPIMLDQLRYFLEGD
ncbi:MAG: tetratricopeptide repeat protein [Bacteroidales bacterium]|nr:tetratricopeptide repeat protein [Bacteroidales bacterium]